MNTIKSAHQTTLRAILVGLAIIAAYALAASVQTIPAQACQINGMDTTGHNYTFNQCNGE